MNFPFLCNDPNPGLPLSWWSKSRIMDIGMIARRFWSRTLATHSDPPQSNSVVGVSVVFLEHQRLEACGNLDPEWHFQELRAWFTLPNIPTLKNTNQRKMNLVVLFRLWSIDMNHWPRATNTTDFRLKSGTFVAWTPLRAPSSSTSVCSAISGHVQCHSLNSALTLTVEPRGLPRSFMWGSLWKKRNNSQSRIVCVCQLTLDWKKPSSKSL